MDNLTPYRVGHDTKFLGFSTSEKSKKKGEIFLREKKQNAEQMLTKIASYSSVVFASD